MRRNVRVQTDAGAIYCFDPAVAARTLREPGLTSWMIEDSPAVRAGRLVGFFTGGDDVFVVQLTTSGLEGFERSYALERLDGFGLDVESGVVVLGGAGFVEGPYTTRVLVPKGSYAVELFQIEWSVSPDFQDPKRAPADFVVALSPSGLRPQQGPSLTSFSATFDFARGDDQFLFDDPSRRVGSPIGALLRGKVVTAPGAAQGLSVRECGVELYSADLCGYRGLRAGDWVEFRLVDIDHERRRMTGELVRRIDEPCEA